MILTVMKQKWIPCLLAVCLFPLWGCSLFQPRRKPDIYSLERELNRTNRRLGEIMGQMAQLMAMVTHNQASIQQIQSVMKTGERETRPPVLAKRPPIKQTAPASKELSDLQWNRTGERLFRTAVTASNRRDHDRALVLFTRLAESYSGHPRASTAAKWVRFLQKKYPETRRRKAVAPQPVAANNDRRKEDSPAPVLPSFDKRFEAARKAYEKRICPGDFLV